MNRMLPPALCVMSLIAGCATAPPISQLRGNAKTATIVQWGHKPLNYSLGVVNGASFWAKEGGNIGGGVAGSTGAFLATSTATAIGTAAANSQAKTLHAKMEALYGNSTLVDDVARKVLPKLAAAWNVPYNPRDVKFVPINQDLMKNGHFVGFNPGTNLVLTYDMGGLELNEKPTVGGALLAGITLGMNTKNVAAQPTVSLSAYRQQPDGSYKRIWNRLCISPAQASPIAYPFPEVIKSEVKAAKLWQAAEAPTVKICSMVIKQSS